MLCQTPLVGPTQTVPSLTGVDLDSLMTTALNRLGSEGPRTQVGGQSVSVMKTKIGGGLEVDTRVVGGMETRTGVAVGDKMG
jgi:hypothetical protein